MDITLVYFIYGLAFFSMGIAMLLESARFPLLAEARVLRPLAFFGFIHGSHEWLEMFLDKSEWVVFSDPVVVGWLRLGLLTISFTSLIVFGVQLLQPLRRYTRRDIVLWGSILLLYLLLVVLSARLAFLSHEDWLYHMDASIRYFFGLVGALIAGIALHRRVSQEIRQENPNLVASLRSAGWGFILYAFTQAVVPPLDIFPARILNTSSFANFTGIPIQVFRAVLAGVITWSLILAIQYVEKERQHQYVAAHERIQREMVEREALRQELLRRTVLAQEEERSRIAHELHDETAQVLTAFSLHLPVLQEKYSHDPEMVDKIHQLQSLSNQMSFGINNLVRNLRPAQLDDLGLVAALQFQASELRKRMGLDVNIQVKGEKRRLEPTVETVLFRVAQEALTNVARHAQVDQAVLELCFTPDQITLQVHDYGTGFKEEKESLPLCGLGIAGMRERVELLGGEFQLQSKIGEGTVVSIGIPIDSSKIANREDFEWVGEFS